MKKFVSKVLVFGLTIMIIHLGLIYYYYQSQNSYSYKKKIANDHLDNTEILVLGDSHSLYGVNPIYFNRRTINLSNVAQPLYYDIQLAEEYIDKMSNLKIIAINLSFISFNYYLENSPDQWRRNFYFAYWEYEPLKADFEFYNNFLELPYTFIKHNLSSVGKIDSLGYQKMEQIPEFWLKENILKNRISLYEEFYKKGRSNKNIEMLVKLIDHMKTRKIKIVFFSTPKFKSYTYKFNQGIIFDFNIHIEDFQRNQKIKFFDQSHSEKFGTDDFRDFDHLNYTGAQKFSKMLSNFIELNIIIE